MIILGHGIDIVECSRIAELLDAHGDRFLRRVYTAVEIEYCCRRRHKVERLAGRFAAKEAILKSLGSGWRGGIAWTDMEISNDPAGRPSVRLAGHTKQLADSLGVADILLSISHTRNVATGSAIAVGQDIRLPQSQTPDQCE